MSDKPSSLPGTGRARGRARGRAQPPPIEESMHSMQAMRISPTHSDNGNGSGNGSGNGNGNGNGNGGGDAAQRGRGGYRGAQELDTRPQNVSQYYAEGGKLVKVLSNFFYVNTPTDSVYTSYHVDFEPSIEAPKLRREMIIGLRNVLFGGEPYLFDGMSNVKTTAPKIDEDIVHFVNNPADKDTKVKITLRSPQEIPWGSMEILRMFNTQMRKNLRHLKFVEMGRNFFDMATRKGIPEHQIALLQGVLTAINAHDGGIMMVVDTATKFIRDKTVLAVLGEYRNRNPDRWLDDAKKEICGSIVMTKYNNKTYRVDDIVTDQNVNSVTFKKGDQMVTMAQYFKQFWNVEIKAPAQPLIKCMPSKRDMRAGRTEPIMLVPELCQLTGLTDQMRQDFNLMKKIGDVSRLPPTTRCDNLMQFIKRVTSNEDVKKEMKEIKMEFETKLVEIDARLLPEEKIYMGNDDDASASSYNQRAADFSKEMRSKRLQSAVSLMKWMIIVPERMRNLVDDFINTAKRVAQPMGISMGNPRVEVLNDDRAGSYINSIQKLKGSPCEMVVTLVPNNNAERYSAIKKCCYVDIAMPSQVIVQKNLTNKVRMMSVCTKIVIQMAAKLKGVPWALKIPPKGLVVIGYDTYHDSMDRNRSVGGFVCSLNQTLTAWYSKTSFHTKFARQEMSSNFAHNLALGLKTWFEKNGSVLPQKIVIYRDGVSDGEIEHVYNYELEQVQSTLKGMFGNVAPPLAFVIVTKRISARFFSVTSQGKDNPCPGTVVDRVVTRQKRYDFYLISQSVRQGTVTPTMYNIIFDNSKFQAQHHQQLAYKLCHLYFNWQGTVRVPAPCQYAHKLAYLTGTALHREHNDLLSDRLFYL